VEVVCDDEPQPATKAGTTTRSRRAAREASTDDEGTARALRWC
jgi:hypothetical protein